MPLGNVAEALGYKDRLIRLWAKPLELITCVDGAPVLLVWPRDAVFEEVLLEAIASSKHAVITCKDDGLKHIPDFYFIRACCPPPLALGSGMDASLNHAGKLVFGPIATSMRDGIHATVGWLEMYNACNEFLFPRVNAVAAAKRGLEGIVSACASPCLSLQKTRSALGTSLDTPTATGTLAVGHQPSSTTIDNI